MDLASPFPLATRASPLALAQTKAVRLGLAKILNPDASPDFARLEIQFPILALTSSGDKNLAASLVDAGGKGLFTKEIEQALLDGKARIAIHSMKDMPALLPQGLIIGGVPERESPLDSLISEQGLGLEALPEGTRIGTSSVRRKAQLLHHHPKFKIVPMRGNVGTRLKKLHDGEADATLLAEAGLRRLNLHMPRMPLDPATHLPALTQGALCLQVREDDLEAQTLVARLNHWQSQFAIAIERGFLCHLDGSCQTPMAGLATVEGSHIHFTAELLSLDGKLSKRKSWRWPCPSPAKDEQADALAQCRLWGAECAQELLDILPKGLATTLGLRTDS